MDIKQLNILLADDDIDDCIFFKSALIEFDLPTRLTSVHDGEQLMKFLTNEASELPDVLFLDLNMPRKNGFECLSEIKNISKLDQLPVIMYSTSFEQEVVNLLFNNGALHFLRKPSDFSQFKKIIQQTLRSIVSTLPTWQPNLPGKMTRTSCTTKENFVLTVQNIS